LHDFLFLLIPYKMAYTMDAGQYMRYKVRSMSTFTSRSGCTESGLRTWALGQATNRFYTPPYSTPAVLPNTITYSNLNISTQQAGNSLPYSETLGTTRIGYGGDYTTPIQPTNPLTTCAFLESQRDFYLPPVVQGGFQIPYTIPTPYKYAGNPAPYAPPLAYLSTGGACTELPSFQGTKATAALAVGNCSAGCDISDYFPSTIVPGAGAY
jgi:hypothetical protein